MATSKRSADYDPIEEALDIGFGIGKEQERARQRPMIESARRGGARKGAAQVRREQEEARRKRTEDRRRTRQNIARRRAQREAETIASARRGAYRAGAADARRAAAASPRPSRGGGGADGATLSAPAFTFRSGGGTGLDKTTGARIIVLSTGLAAVGSVYLNTIKHPPVKQSIQLTNGETLKVPTNLRGLAGVLIAGTVALIVNELDPRLGVIMAVILLADVGIGVFAGPDNLTNRVGAGLTGKTGTVPVKVPPPSSSPKSGFAPKGGASGQGGGGGGGGSW